MTILNPQNPLGFTPVNFGLAPPTSGDGVSPGPRVTQPLKLDFTNTPLWSLDLQRELAEGIIPFAQAMYVNLTNMTGNLTVTFSDGIFLTLVAGKQYFLPLMDKGTGQIAFVATQSAQSAQIAFLNMPIPFLEFGPNQSPLLVSISGIPNIFITNPVSYPSVNNQAGVGTGTYNSGDQTSLGGKGGILKANITVLTAGSVTFSIQGKDVTSGNYYTILASAAIAVTGEITPLRVFPGLPVAANLTVNDLMPKIWRIQAVVVTGPATFTTEFDSIV